MATKFRECLQEPEIYELLSTKLFWVWGVFLALNGYWINQQVEQFTELERRANKPDSKPKATDPASGPTNSPASTTISSTRYSLFWLQPHITSRPRQALAFILCSPVLPL